MIAILLLALFLGGKFDAPVCGNYPTAHVDVRCSKVDDESRR